MLVLLITACSQTPNIPMNNSIAIDNLEKHPALIAYLPSGMTSPFYSQAAKAAAQYGEKYGMQLEAQAPPAETDFNGQMAIFENFISKKVDGVIFCAIDSNVLAPSIKKANQANIPLIVFNSLTPLVGGKIAGYVGYNQYKAGYAVGEYTGKLLKGSGKVFIIRGVPGYHDTLRSNGFHDALKKFPDITVTGERVGEWVRDKSIPIATDTLHTHPDTNLILGMNDEMAIGASIAARNLGKDVYTIGIDGNPISMEEIEKGNLTATFAAFPEKIGEVAMEQMRKLLNKISIQPFLETPGYVVDKTNLEDYKTGKLWTAPKTSEPELIGKP
jgi:ABC-type sugar transport system substrate-binding protein